MDILIDLDNVTANLIDAWLAIYNSTYNDSLTADKVLDWQMDLYANKCSAEELHQLIATPGFFTTLAVIPDAIEVTKRLQDVGHDLYFVTATPHNCPTGGYDKLIWCHTHFPHIGKDRVIQTQHKHKIIGDILFDDGPHNLIAFPKTTIAMDMPYNKATPADYRVSSWLQFEKVVGQIANPSSSILEANEK
jgi:5'(3')-deoxyribonucleotidase